MQAGHHQRNHVLGLLGSLSILLLLMPVRDSPWGHASALVPWIWTLCWTPARLALKRLVLNQACLVATSVGLSSMVLLGCIVRQSSPAELQIVPAPLVWMPVAAILITTHNHTDTWGRKAACTLLALAITITAAVICIQLWLMKVPRPQGVFYGVLNGPDLLMMAALLLAMTDSSDLKRWRWYALIALMGAVSSMARTPLIAFVTATLIVAFWDTRHLKRTLLLCTPIAIGWGIFLKQRFLTLQTDMTTYQSGQYSSSAGDRVDALRWAKEHIFDNVLFGMGPNDLQRAFNARWVEWNRLEESITRIVHLHNDYIQIPIAYGIPAFFLFLLFWVFLSAKTTTSGGTKRSSAFILATVGVFATTSLTDSYSYWTEGWSFIFACAGFAVAILNINRNFQIRHV